MRVLVTGASGFVGSALVPALAAKGFFVRAAARDPSTMPLRDNIEPATLPDLAGHADWAPLLSGIDAVVHLAGIAHAGGGIPEERYDQVNRAATKSLAEAAARQNAARLIFVSSIRAQTGPATARVLRESDPAEPTSPYGRSKLAAETALRSSAVPFTIFRPVVMYGPGVKGNIASLLRLARTPLPLPLGDFKNPRSLLAIDNLISAVAFALQEPRTAGETYIVADRSPFSVRDIVTMMRMAMQRRANLIPVPQSLFAAGLALAGQRGLWDRLGGALVADPRKLLDAGWQPAIETPAAIAAMVKPPRP